MNQLSKCCGADLVRCNLCDELICSHCTHHISNTAKKVDPAPKQDGQPTEANSACCHALQDGIKEVGGKLYAKCSSCQLAYGFPLREPKRDGQMIPDAVNMYGLYVNQGTGWNFHKTVQAIETYCAERERLARIDELDRFMSSKAIEKVVLGKDIDRYYNQRVAELQKQSSSQEEAK